MAGGSNEALHVIINRKLQGHVLLDYSAFSIFKVPNPLRKINEKAYEPQVISIGPYHRGKDHLKAMEVQKMNSLKFFLDRKKEKSVEKYVTGLEEIEEQARKFYSEPLDETDGKKFVEMMLLDGCFILELIRQTMLDFIRPRTSMINLLPSFHWEKIGRDLLLIENQLPFLVLSKLYSLYKNEQSLDTAEERVANKVVSFFLSRMPGRPTIKARTRHKKVKHILGLLHDLSYSSEEVKSVTCTPQEPPRSATAVSFPWWAPCLALASLPSRSPSSAMNVSVGAEIDPPAQAVPGESSTQKWQFIRSATELNEAGIKFQKNQGKLFDIKFQKRVMSIPTLIINDDTETVLRNLVAYEQHGKCISSAPFTDYITFMDCLINTGKDVELLCRCGVLVNWLGDHEVVATMFNRLRDFVFTAEPYFFYSEIFNRVNEHCNRKWNLWKANLWHNYFNTPWALISFFAAVILLLSTLLQVLFSILSYHY